MSRYLFVFLNLLPFVFLVNTTEFKKDELNIELTCPEQVDPGSTFEVQLKITGGQIKNFAKYVDKLPAGFEAEALEVGDATFTADNGQVKILWVNFPQQEEVIITYKMKVLDSAPKEVTIGGKFSYMENNEKRVFSVIKETIDIGKPAMAQAQAQQKVEASASVVRKLLKSRDDVHQIQLTITHEGIEGFAKIQEYLPYGAEVEEGEESQNAAFSFVKNKMKFVWMAIPQKSPFVIDYYIDLSKAEDKDPRSITGNFSFLDDGQSRKEDIVYSDEETQVLASAKTAEDSENATGAQGATQTEEQTTQTSEDENNAMASNDGAGDDSGNDESSETSPESTSNSDNDGKSSSGSVNMGATAAAIAAASSGSDKEESSSDQSGTGNEDQTSGQNGGEEVMAANSAKAEESAKTKDSGTAKESTTSSNKTEATEPVTTQKEEIKTVPATASNQSGASDTRVTANNPVANGLVYRVQIAAGDKVVDAAYFQNRHNFSQQFNIENHEGWVKYTTGSYKIYRDARDSREVINGGGHKFDGPFVTAYNNGNRITVQEALMISNQQWFK